MTDYYNYDYEDAVLTDIIAYLNEEGIAFETYADREQAFEDLYDRLFMADSVTGNASGSYFCNAHKAEQCVAHNHDLFLECMDDWGCEWGDYKHALESAEYEDVCIRCYLVGRCLNIALDNHETDCGVAHKPAYGVEAD